ncbi:Vitellogenin [Frankliniella fusca]|uniref:Vitellogenin n=1 Tax=Frankliniella fusca TaxID=407009 RepID=A0AAE1H1C9_9NEOP|nr:Vitellogenin [Frankliniella fusca]KAK3912729.1 Vitellogenin [Frankliniella fusca]
MEMEMHQHFGCSAIMSPSGCCSVKYGLVCHTYQFLATNYFDKKVAQILCTLNNVKVKANKENQGCEVRYVGNHTLKYVSCSMKPSQSPIFGVNSSELYPLGGNV